MTKFIQNWTRSIDLCKRVQREPKWNQKATNMYLKIRPRAALGPAERVDIGSVLRVSFPHAPFPRSRFGFCNILFFSRRIPSWIPPFPSLVGRLICTFWRPFGWKWVVVFSLCFLGVFFDDFCRVFYQFLGIILHVFGILVRTVFLLTFSSDVFQMYAHFQNTGSSKDTVFLE